MIDETVVMSVAFIMGLAPAMGIIWVAVAKYAADMFQSADETALTEKSNPALLNK